MTTDQTKDDQKVLEGICRKHNIAPAGPFFELSLSNHTWLVFDERNRKWVIKRKGLDSRTAQAAGNFSLLHPLFEYPAWISDPGDSYQVYPYLSGDPLAHGSYEDEAIIEGVQDLALRFRAMMRSMVLTDFYREPLQQEKNTDPASRHRLRDLRNIQGMDERYKDQKTRQARESFQ